jgi:hypothetical protein
MTYLYCFALLLILGKFLNHLRTENATLSLQNKFTALNSKLFELLQSGKVSTEDKHFAFLRKSIEGSERTLARVNFWIIVYLAYKNRRNLNGVYLEFEKEFANPELKQILNQYTKYSCDYFVTKNLFSICSFYISLRTITLITKIFNKTRGLSFSKNFKRDFKYFIIKEENTSAGAFFSRNGLFHYANNNKNKGRIIA